MAQKDKVKELVGRSLDSYHTKALQQIDRIEKKNKEQNHKINILTNELDNDYLTKTEEGSVISLEHSKEGMIYLDELQGNTLVNYCVDGAKELTLNGDIDVEGTNVTLTEGVDGGKVDVMCEGNTLVNIINDNWYYGTVETKNNRECLKIQSNSSANLRTITNIKSGVPYTLIYDYMSTKLVRGTTNPFGRLHLTLSNENGWVYDISVKDFASNQNNFTTSISVFTIPTHINFTTMNVTGVLRDIEGTVWVDKKILLLEGDWSNKEIPQHFIDMKSVGECEDNKIEIVSQNKNLFDKNNSEISRLYIPSVSVGDQGAFNQSNGLRSVTFKCEKNTDYTISRLSDGYAFRIYGAKEKPSTGVKATCLFVDNNKLVATINSEDYSYLQIVYYSHNAQGSSETHAQEVINGLQIEYGKTQTNYVNYNINKKEISLNEPLRGLPNGVKDKIVKIGGKWYVERNCYQTKFNTTNFTITIPSTAFSNGYQGVYAKIKNQHTPINVIPMESSKYIICDKVSIVEGYGNNIGDREGVCLWTDSSADIAGRFKVDTIEYNFDATKQYIDNLDLTIVYQLATPIYEPLEIEPTLNTYNDVTHVSNNSLIPCNMKIQNSGYNAIIKPSTLYTVALDTNKSGTIGINLGGAKVTTNNNVATITTPATLTDDSLRLYGKGINASKVRLLEGNKTNWIPSHFEGMKSSFEDKLQEDGTFKMEIISNNGNLINLEEQVRLNKQSGMNCSLKEYNGVMSWEIHTQSYVEYYNYLRYQYKPNTQYTMYFDCNMTPYDDRTTFAIKVMYENSHTETFSMNKDTKNVQFTTLENRTVKKIYFSNWQYSGYVNIYNMKFCEGSDVLVEEKSNKLQFSSIEPLRGIGDVKDKFVFKDGKLMIERNTIKIVLNGSERWGEYDRQLNRPLKSKCYYMVGYDKFDISDNNSVCDIFSNVKHCYDSADINCFSDYHTAPNKYFTSFCNTLEEFKEYLKNNNATLVGKIKEPTYEEISFELQKVILEGYENGTLFFDTNIPPTSTVTYAGETPIVKSVKLNKTEVLNNSNDINDNIVPYLMDMDYRVVCLQLEGGIENVSMARLFGGTFEMLQRDILSKRYSIDEYRYRLDAYLSANKITDDEYTKLGEMLND